MRWKSGFWEEEGDFDPFLQVLHVRSETLVLDDQLRIFFSQPRAITTEFTSVEVRCGLVAIVDRASKMEHRLTGFWG